MKLPNSPIFSPNRLLPDLHEFARKVAQANNAMSDAITTIGGGDLTYYATSNTTQGTSGTASALTFAGAGVASVGITNNSIVISVPAGGAGDGFNILAAGTQTAGTNTTVNFANSNGITFGMSGSNQITASHNGLTTARASNDGIGLNTAATNVTWTVNSAGISLNAGAYLTTAAQSNHSHGNPTLALTNLAGTTASNSAGLTLSLSATAQSAQPVAYSAANGSANFSTLTFANSNGVSFSTGTQGLYATVATNYAATNVTTNNMATSERGNYFYTSNNTFANSTHTHGNVSLALTNLTGTTASASNGLTLSLSAAAPGGGGGAGTNTALNLTNLTGTLAVNTNGVSISMSAAAPGGGASPSNRFAQPINLGPIGNITNVTGTAVSGRVLLFPFNVFGNLTADELMWMMSRAATGSDNWSLSVGIYSYSNSSRIDLISSNSQAYSFTATASNSGIRIWEATVPVTTLSAGQYILGMRFSGAATASMNYSLMGASTSNWTVAGVCHPGTNSNMTHSTHQVIPFFGRMSVTTSNMPASIGISDVHGLGTNAIPLNFWLATHI